MTDISVIVCTRNPRGDYLRRVVDALNGQTLPKDKWELLVVDNASNDRLAERLELSWHPRSRLVREDDLGLTPARIRGISEASGQLLVFVDDDNVLAPNFLEIASALHARFPHLGAFGAGSLEPEFEVQPPSEILPRIRLLAIRTVSSARWSKNAQEFGAIPWGAGLCVIRSVANSYRQSVKDLDVAIPLDRKGEELFSGGDDLFSWVAAAVGYEFGIFPELRVTHLIAADRLSQSYFLRLVNDHTYSNFVRHYLFDGIQPQRLDWRRYIRLLLHGIKNGQFSMRCRWAALTGEDRAARFILEKRLQPQQIRSSADFSEGHERRSLKASTAANS
ncbi:MAG TPA: glycosyltransferase [Candidatus Acidoferrum sp.]|jgi:glycosyltransferase involved in cell wall biosynthesis